MPDTTQYTLVDASTTPQTRLLMLAIRLAAFQCRDWWPAGEWERWYVRGPFGIAQGKN